MNSNCQWSFTRVQSQALPLVEQAPVCHPPNQGYESGPIIRSQEAAGRAGKWRQYYQVLEKICMLSQLFSERKSVKK